VIAQYFDDAALADTIMLAFFDHAPQLLAQGFQLFQPDFHLLKLRPGDRVGGGTARFGRIGEPEQGTDRLDAESQFPGVADEFQPLHIFGAIEPMATLRAAEGANKTDALVVPDGLDFGRGGFRELADGHAGHLFFLESLVARDCTLIGAANKSLFREKMMNRRTCLKAFTTTIITLAHVGAWSKAFAQDEANKALADRLLAAAPSIGERSMGKTDAPVVLIEYASATCQHSAKFNDRVLPLIRKDYVDTGKVRFIFREFPLDQLSIGVFLLARCLPEEKYFPTIDMLFRRQKSWSKENTKKELLRVLQLSGMDAAAFETCLKREDLSKAIFDSAMKARTEFGVRGTPTLFINGQMADGRKDFAEIKSLIDAALSHSG